MLEKLEAINEKFIEIERQMNDPEVMNDMKHYVKLSKDYKDLQPVINAYKEYKNVLKILNSEETLFEMNENLRQHICRLIGFEPSVRYTTEYVSPETEGIRDLRNTLHPKKDVSMAVPEFMAKPYYQVVELKHPFMPNLSILDLLFNMGPESILVLRDSIKTAK